MSLKRIIPVLLHRHGRIVLSRGFSLHRPVGDAFAIADRYKAWDLDELIYLDISSHHGAAREYAMDRFAGILGTVSRNCFVPLAAGGGIATVDDINRLIHAGADRVVLNSAAAADPDLITRAAKTFGAQAVIVGIDARRTADGTCRVFTHGGQRDTGMDVRHWAEEAAKRGAGEIFIQSIDRDGTGAGYDEALIREILDCAGLPVIACGGAGRFEDFAMPLRLGAQAAAAANIFAFRELSYMLAKSAAGRDAALRPSSLGMDFVAARGRADGLRVRAEQTNLWHILDKGGLME